VRGHLIALAMLCVLPGLLVLALFIQQSYQRERALAVQDVLSNASNISGALQREFMHAEAALVTLASSLAFEQGNLRDIHTIATRALPNLRAESIVLTRSDRQVLMSTKRSVDAELPRIKDAPLLEKILRGQSMGVSNLFTGPITGELIIGVAVPVKHDGKVTGSLTATMSPDRFSKLLTEMGLPASWRASIIDASGRIVGRSHGHTSFVGRLIPAEQLQRMRASPEGTFELTSLDGVAMLTAFKTLPGTQWMVAVGIPVGEVSGPAYSRAAWLATATLMAIALGLLLALLAGRRITRAIHTLVEPAAALSVGGVIKTPEYTGLAETNAVADALVRASHALEHRSQEVRKAQRLARIGSWTWDVASNAVTWSPEMYRLFGHDESLPPIPIQDIPASFTAESWTRLSSAIQSSLQSGMPYECDAEVIRPDGHHLWVVSRGEPVRDREGRITGLLGTTQDISERKEAEELRRLEAHSRHLSLHDPLTGIANRSLLVNRLEHAVAQARRADSKMAIIYIDLDYFKPINDTHGHQAGDHVLCEVASRLADSVRRTDTVARIGGDEFVVMLDDVEDIKVCQLLAAKVVRSVARPILWGRVELTVGASAGIACYPDDAASAEELMSSADAAMYRTKAGRKSPSADGIGMK
jgi:diguanylate cyclase (GGDEF)-like protein/PAS domain S-box-containing protein